MSLDSSIKWDIRYAGSRHNRGCAVDLSLYRLSDGQPVDMPSVHDEMSERAYATYAGGTAPRRRMRDLLRAAMAREGFTVCLALRVLFG